MQYLSSVEERTLPIKKYSILNYRSFCVTPRSKQPKLNMYLSIRKQSRVKQVVPQSYIALFNTFGYNNNTN
jgi:hypothetical protein